MSSDCLFCGSKEQRLLLSLGKQPLANSYLLKKHLKQPEPVYPLDLYICEQCKLVHVDAVAGAHEIFSDYAYFSSFSTTWLDHARDYTNRIIKRLALNRTHFVLEIASNDGYLLKNFVKKNIPCLGIEPAANVAQVAQENGVDTLVAFWGQETAQQLFDEGREADLIIGNNVLAHVPDLNDFVAGLKTALSDRGVVTMEFPHLYRLAEETQFDTIYHEHFSYFSFFVVSKVFARHGMTLFDVDELTTHGGSLRIYACHEEDESKELSPRVGAVMRKEADAGMMEFAYYERFVEKVQKVRSDFLAFVKRAARDKKRVAGYGAPAKGNTFLNYCGVKAPAMAYTVDRSPHKQGHYLPGSRIPIHAVEKVFEDKPDYLVILPWNLKDEIVDQMQGIREWGGQFVVAIPEMTILE